ncbi:YadA-like family protein [Haemophilus sp. Marseille-Q0026]|uniref:YadA-like family protein n=1 Tax=Haemophilus sp. Marseille-Q0026 TaxID=2866580 RepID=UPI001CF8109A|nr:YadA-like family protein [Haemophilus sp. Marseille-Q0026]
MQEEKASVKDLNAISENVKEGFDSIQDKVHNLQEALAGDGTEEKPGLIKSVSSAVEELNDNIAKKADQSAVDDINAELDARAKALKTLQEEKASVKDLNAISENVKEGFNSIQDKVHNLQEALAGDGTEEKPGLIKSVSSAVEELNDNIAKKADQSAVDDINAELDARAKALKTLQEEKASVKDLNAISENVKEGFNSIQDKVHNLQEALAGDGTEEKPGLIKSVSSAVEELNDNIAKKANQADVEANKAEIAKFGAQTNSNAALLLTMAGKVDQNKKDTDEAIAKNASAIVNIRNKQVLQNARLDNHGERIEANEAAIGELAKATDESVKNLGNAVNDLDENLAGTQEAVAENRKDIDKNASRITDTRNKQALQNARLDNHGERIEANEAAIGELAKATDESVKNLGNAVNDLDENLAGTQEAVAENRKDIDKNASRITDTRNKQALQNARLDNHGERIEANEAAIGELAKATDESVKNLGNAVNDLDENLAGTQEAVAENRKDIDANAVAIDKLKETQTYKDLSKVETLVKDKADKTAVEKNASRITDTRNKQVLQNARLDNHGERIEANKAAIGDLATVIDEAVTNLDGVVNDLHGDLSVTKHTVAENRKDIDKNASRITNTRNKQVLQNARLDNHSNRIATNKSDIATNKADITTNKADITTNKADIATNKADITTNKADITTNKADIATNKADIATNKADIADSKANIITNRANITANTAAIATHNQRLDHLDNRVNKLDKDLKRGLATQAALTGLFQPYTVGKANVTAAVGGYKSQTAVAIGTGYRYNKHVATKAGVAFTQGGAAYNVGVNFEW